MAKPRTPLVVWGRVVDGLLQLDNRRLLDAALKHASWQRRVVVTVAAEEETRRQKQNRYYWAVVVKTIAEETGHTSDQMHEILKYKFNSEIVEMVDPGTGEAEELRVPKSTAKLSVADFAHYIDQCAIWAGEFLGIVLPESEAREHAA